MQRKVISMLLAVLLTISMVVIAAVSVFAVNGPEPVSEGPFLKLNTSSNFFPATYTEYNKGTKQITVTFYMKSSKDVLDTQWFMYYDPTVLAPATKDGKNENKPTTICPTIGTMAGPINYAGAGIMGGDGLVSVRYSANSLYLFDFSKADTIFASLVFDVVAEEPTETDLKFMIDILRVSSLNEDTEMTDSKEEVSLVFKGNVMDVSNTPLKISLKTEVTSSSYVEPVTEPSTEPENTESQSSLPASPDVPSDTEPEVTTAPTKTEPVVITTEPPTQQTTTVPPTTIAPTTAAPTTVAATTKPIATTAPATASTTAVPTTKKPVATSEALTTESATSGKYALTVNATSNYFPSAFALYNADTEEVVVTYCIKSSRDLLNTQWYLTYDPQILKLSDKTKLDNISPAVSGNGAILKKNIIRDGVGYIEFVASSTSLYDISTELTPFVTVVFDVKNISNILPVSTTVDLVIQSLKVSELDENGISDASKEVLLVDDEIVLNNSQTSSVNISVDTALTPSNYVEPEIDDIENTSGTNTDNATEPMEGDTVSDMTDGTDTDFSNIPTVPATMNSATKDTAPKNNIADKGAVQTGEAPLAAITLLLLIVATSVMFVLRKKEMF